MVLLAQESTSVVEVLSVVLNWPDGHVVHSRSFELVAATLVNVPAGQGELVAMQGLFGTS